MPLTQVYFYRESDGTVPALDWLRELRSDNRKAYAKCIVSVHLLSAQGYELRRPYADMLRDGIHELRVKVARVNYRILYFFHGRNAVVLSHGLTKEQSVDAADIERAIHRRRACESNPAEHLSLEDINDA